MERRAPIAEPWVALRSERTKRGAEPHTKRASRHVEDYTIGRARCHADSIAVAEAEGEVRSIGRIPNRIESIRSDPEAPTPGGLKVCYEAAPCGYV